MPQLLSRRDNSGWLTPAMADILTHQMTTLPTEDALRHQINYIQQRLAELHTPLHITDLHASASHTFFIAQAESRPRQQLASKAEYRNSLKQLATENPEWTLGYMPELPNDSGSFGILMRTAQHQPVRLRHALLSNAFQLYNAPLALVPGLTLDQQIMVADLDELGHLLIAGPAAARQRFLRTTLMTLLLFNTPAELRLAILGHNPSTTDFSNTPHMLGRIIDSPENGQRLLDGMLREAQRRRQWLLDAHADSLEAYNELQDANHQPPIPRIIIAFNTLNDEAWHTTQENWSPALYDLIVNGGRIGIHILLTADALEDVPPMLDAVLYNRVVMRSAAPALARDLPYLHSTALRFVDAFLVRRNHDDEVIPLELCTVPEHDIEQLISYWQHNAHQRSLTLDHHERTGITDLLPELEGSRLGNPDHNSRTGTGPLPTRTRAGTLARATQVLSGETNEKLVIQCMTLAAYLGWLGVGPLCDIFGISNREALAIIHILQGQSIIEAGDGPVYRFIRLADNPLASGMPEIPD